jgi:hypothetical protein
MFNIDREGEDYRRGQADARAVVQSFAEDVVLHAKRLHPDDRDARVSYLQGYADARQSQRRNAGCN